MSPFFTARLLLIFFASYIFAACAYVSYRLEPEWNFRLFHFLSVLLICFVTALWSWKKRPPLSSAERKWLFWSSVLAVFFWFFYRYPVLFLGPIWFDEITQFLNNMDGQIISLAAQQQQPPIDYFLSKFAALLVGMSETGVLFHAILFGILSYVVFGLWMVAIRAPIPWIALGFLFFSNHNVLLQYSAEARPVSIAVFFALLYLLFITEALQTKKIPFCAIFSSATLLLFSTSLQPMFFLVLIPICLWPTAKLYFPARQWLMAFLVSAIVPLVLFFPTLDLIYREAAISAQFLPGSHLERWMTAIGSFQLESLSPYLQSSGPVLFGLPVLLLILSFVLYRRNQIPIFYWRLALSGFLFFALFPIFFQIFWGTINWSNFERYFVLWIVGSLIFLWWGFTPILRKRHVNLLLIPLAIYGIFSFTPTQWDAARRAYTWRPDWRPVILNLKSENENTLFVEVPYLPLTPFGHGTFHHLAAQIYLSENQYVPRLTANQEKIDFLDFTVPLFRLKYPLERLNVSHPNRLWTVHFAVYNTTDTPYASLVQVSDKFDSVRSLGDHTVLTLSSQDSPLEAIMYGFTAIVETDLEHPNNYYMLDAIVSEALRRGDRSRTVRRHFDALKKIVLNSAVKDDPALPRYLSYLEQQMEKRP